MFTLGAPGKGTQDPDQAILLDLVQVLAIRGHGTEGVIADLSILLGLSLLDQ